MVYCLIIIQIRYQTYDLDNATDTNGDRRRRMHSSIRFQHQTDRGDANGNEWDVTEDEEWGRSMRNNGGTAMRSRVGVRTA